MAYINYNWIGAHYANIKLHWQKDVERLGMKVIAYEVNGICDCTIMKVENLPVELPSYISIIDNFPEGGLTYLKERFVVGITTLADYDELYQTKIAYDKQSLPLYCCVYGDTKEESLMRANKLKWILENLPGNQ